MPACFLVHGYADPAYGASNIDKLGPLIQKKGYTIEQFDYETRWNTWHHAVLNGMGQQLAARAKPGDIAVGFSTGCLLIYLALKKYSAPFTRVILVSPNMDNDVKFPGGSLEKIFVWHSPSDTVLKSAATMPFHPFGDLGRVGYKGPPDARVKTYDKENDFAVKSKVHDAVLENPSEFAFFAPLIIADVPDLTTALGGLGR